ncbi:unnamed protein product [Mytilus coruscus]|uniref:TRIM71 n=1 Tax=Mytilus coruscus TaxID=42192 RepID=A0A6J8CT85_MYTCO|nr:unnamed protein product [Mytilus coruscus]
MGNALTSFLLKTLLAKSSELLRDLEQSLGDVLKNIKRIREDRENNLQSIQTQKNKITMEIDNIKTRISQHLDKLKVSFIRELEQAFDNYYGRIQTIISSLKNQEHEIRHCSTEFELIKKYASNLQTFLVDFKQKLYPACSWPSGCSRTRIGAFLFTDYGTLNFKLVTFNDQRKTAFEINLPTAYTAFDVTSIDENTVAITINPGDDRKGHDFGISIVDLTKKKATRFIDLPDEPYGITYNGKSLICCVQDKDIHVISCTDYSVDTVPNTVLRVYSYVSTHADKIVFKNGYAHKVFCCLYDGTPLWEFNDEVLRTPHGITVDNRGNVFVAGCYSGNAIVISPDGKQCKQILNTENGLNYPYENFVDKLRNQLLLTNNSTVAYLYNISYL